MNIKHWNVIWASFLLVVIAIVALIVFDEYWLKHKAQTQKVEYVIGVAHADLSENWQIDLDDEIKSQLSQYPNVKIISTNANGSTYKQMKDLETLSNYGIDLLIVTPNDSMIIKREIKKTMESIPVIIMNREITGNDYTLFIGPDYSEIGKKAGQRVAQILNETSGKLTSNGDPMYQGSIIEIKGPFESLTAQRISRSFWEQIHKNTLPLVYTEFSADWKKDLVKEWMRDFTKNPFQADVIFAHGDDMAVGAYEGARSNGYMNIPIISVGSMANNNLGVEAVQSGEFNTSYIWPLGGKEALDYAVKILEGNQNIPKKIILNNFEITSENVNDYVRNQVKSLVKPNEMLKVAFIQSNADTDWRKAETDSILKNAQNQNISVEQFTLFDSTDIQEQQNQQIKYIQECIANKYDVIALSPVTMSGWDTVLTEAQNAKIPIILVNELVEGDAVQWLSYLGYDGRSEGTLAGEWIIDKLYNQEMDIRIAAFYSNENSYSTMKRIEGIKESTNGYSRIELKNETKVEGDYVGMNLEIKQILEKNKGTITVFFAFDENMALQISKALKKMGKKIGKDIQIISIGGTETAYNSLNDGDISCFIESKPDIGQIFLTTINAYRLGENVPKSVINGNRTVDLESDTK